MSSKPTKLQANMTGLHSKLVQCSHESCEKTFFSVFGMEQHYKKVHGDFIQKREKQECPFCGKTTIYIHQHIKSVHKEMIEKDKCDVCQQVVKFNMKKHRSVCITCPICGYQNKKKERLLNHIEKHPKIQSEALDLTPPRKELHSQQEESINLTTPQKGARGLQSETIYSAFSGQEPISTQSKPLDLASPRKEIVQETPFFKIKSSKESSRNIMKQQENNDSEQSRVCHNVPELAVNCGSDWSKEGNKDLKRAGADQFNIEETTTDQSTAYQFEENSVLSMTFYTESGSKKRINYPFDNVTDPYESEYDSNDEDEFTVERRKLKDGLELELRSIDRLERKESDGDFEILDQFEKFMRKKSRKKLQGGGYSSDVSTVGMYTRAIRNDILPAFHKLVQPFHGSWIIDCTTKKEYTFEEEQIFYVKPEEPIYMTPKIIETALEMSKQKGGQQGGQRGTIINAAIQLMNFVEMYFNEKLNLYGKESYDKVVSYHQAVKTHINATGTWRMCNDEKDRAQQENRVRQEYEHPNKDAEVLQEYKRYINSKKRLKNINKVLNCSNNDSKRPTDREFTEIGKIVMGEIVAATGCRPVVLLKMPNAAYIDKKGGFNPYEISDEDCVLDEEQGMDKIYRRVNPNLPPKARACKHQLEQGVAECPVMCADRCDPDGYNILITWDKTGGPSYLHIPKELKHLMDIYDLKRVRYFKGRKSPYSDKDDWIHDDYTPFFLNSACSTFKSLDLSHISEAMKIDVTAYNFRKIVSTWALSHASLDIQNAEQEALQHSLNVAKAHYQQNKQIQPQKLVQQYVAEQNLFPEDFKEGVAKTKLAEKNAIEINEQKRTTKRIETLQKRREDYLSLKDENKPLGSRHRIRSRDKKRFLKLLMELNCIEDESAAKNMKPKQWRHLTVRAVCTAKQELGAELRDLWKTIYKGDLKWGIRDARWKAERNNWPRNQVTTKRDRNSWISASIRHSLLTEKSKNIKNVD